MYIFDKSENGFEIYNDQNKLLIESSARKISDLKSIKDYTIKTTKEGNEIIEKIADALIDYYFDKIVKNDENNILSKLIASNSIDKSSISEINRSNFISMLELDNYLEEGIYSIWKDNGENPFEDINVIIM